MPTCRPVAFCQVSLRYDYPAHHNMILPVVSALILFTALALDSDHLPCKSRDYGNGSPICVCDAAYCDTVAQVGPVGENMAVVYTSDKSGRRLERTVLPKRLQKTVSPAVTVALNTSQTYQTIHGFGGAFTDAAGINIASLPDNAQTHLLRSYFSTVGIEYTIGRVVLGSADFSPRPYSYDDVENDFGLKHFALVQEDLKYKIPYIKAAQNISSRPIKLFGSSWSAPGWMKTTGKMESNGTLRGHPTPDDPYYSTWATYYVKFLQEYTKHSVSFWALTSQNEPTTGYLYNYSFQTQGFTPEMQRDFIKNNLGPALHQNGFQNVSIIILDDNRLMLPSWARTVLSDSEARKYISHIGVHWYFDRFTPTHTLEKTHQEFPSVPLFGTEACIIGDILIPGWKPVLLGSWERAEHYVHDIIEDLNHWFVGWTDWNLALNLKGGPNWVNNLVDSPIIVNATAGEFYKQPMYYALGHFSKFLPPNSVRVGFKSNADPSRVQLTAFLNTDGYKVVIAMNKYATLPSVAVHFEVDADDFRDETSTNLSLADTTSSKSVLTFMPARSIVTILWK